MPLADSALQSDEIARARALLSAPKRTERLWPAVAAAGALAVSALAFATAMVLAPPLVTQSAVRTAPD